MSRMAYYTKEQFDRLPKWAQREIDRLTMRLREASERLSAGPGDSNVFAHPYCDNPTPLGRDTMVKFVMGEASGDALHVGIFEDGLRVYGHRGIVIQPRARNAVDVRFSQGRAVGE